MGIYNLDNKRPCSNQDQKMDAMLIVLADEAEEMLFKEALVLHIMYWNV